jgi:hypothetical protein
VQDLHGVGIRGAEPVRFAGVELGYLTGPEGEFAFSEDEAQFAGQDVEPFIAVVGHELLLARREDVLEDLDSSRVLGQRHHDIAAVPAVGPEMDPGVPGGRRCHQLVQGDTVRSCERDEQLERRAPLA